MIILTKWITSNTKTVILRIKQITYMRNFSNLRNKFGIFDSVKTRNIKLKLRDKVSNDYDLIYRTNFDNYVYSARAFGILTTVVITPIMFYADYYSPAGITKVPIKPDVEGFIQSSDKDIYIYATSLLLFNLMLIIYSGRFPLRIYRHAHKQNYIALFPTYIPFAPKQVLFNMGDVKPLLSNGFEILPWTDAQHTLCDQKIYLFEHCFKTPDEYYTIVKSA